MEDDTSGGHEVQVATSTPAQPVMIASLMKNYKDILAHANYLAILEVNSKDEMMKGEQECLTFLHAQNLHAKNSHVQNSAYEIWKDKIYAYKIFMNKIQCIQNSIHKNSACTKFLAYKICQGQTVRIHKA